MCLGARGVRRQLRRRRFSARLRSAAGSRAPPPCGGRWSRQCFFGSFSARPNRRSRRAISPRRPAAGCRHRPRARPDCRADRRFRGPPRRGSPFMASMTTSIASSASFLAILERPARISLAVRDMAGSALFAARSPAGKAAPANHPCALYTPACVICRLTPLLRRKEKGAATGGALSLEERRFRRRLVTAISSRSTGALAVVAVRRGRRVVRIAVTITVLALVVPARRRVRRSRRTRRRTAPSTAALPAPR